MRTSIVVIFLFALAVSGFGATGGRVLMPIDAGWTFAFGDSSNAPAAPGYPVAGWEGIDLPHTWNASDGQDGGNDYRRGIGWYRKSIAPDPSLAGKRVFIQFDGANAVTTLFVNGREIGTHRGGFARFRFDVTGFMDPEKENLVAVKVSNAPNPDIPPLDADFTFFGGIYRHVSILATGDLAISCMDLGSSGVSVIQKSVSSARATLTAKVLVDNSGRRTRKPTVRIHLLDRAGNTVAQGSQPVAVTPGSVVTAALQLAVKRPHLWNGRADPYLYRVVVDLVDDGALCDEVSEPLGIRSIAVDREKGFFLNGKPYPLRGVNKHQDRQGKGWAVSEADMEEDFALMSEMGVTAIRMAHYQHPIHEYDLADSLGMVLWTEIPVVNRITASAAFADNATQQLRELVRQNINHPSVVFWGIANEITLQAGPDPQPLMQRLALEAKREDPSRLNAIASAAGDNHPTNWNTDVAGFNKYFGWYVDSLKDFAPWVDKLHRNRTKPSERIGVTEYGAGASIRFHADTLRIQDHTEEYQSLYHEVYWNAMSERPFIWGTFVWNMFDFAVDFRTEGDTPGRNDKGLVTFDRKVRKDSFFWYKANWTKEPMVYIASRRFNPRPTSPVCVTAYTNLERVELLVNGRSLGIRPVDHQSVRWDHVPLTRGKNRVEVRGGPGGESVTDRVLWDY